MARDVTQALMWAALGAAFAADPQTIRGFHESVSVVSVTPIEGWGVPRARIPANVQTFRSTQVTGRVDVPSALAERASGLHLSDVQAGAFQPDAIFRGFSASPLLGAPEALAVYQNGVRMNDPFGDTIHWDLIAVNAIATIDLMPGSNPLFGLNALGGALAMRTKDGFTFPGRRASLEIGSFGRRTLQAESGGTRGRLGYFAAATLVDESGWRAHSPSTIRQLFATVGWKQPGQSIDISLSGSSNDLTGNGTVPPSLLAGDWSAVFTHPDRTSNDSLLASARMRSQPSPALLVETLAYYKASRTRTFNGDAAERTDDATFDASNNESESRSATWGWSAQLSRGRSRSGRGHRLLAGASFDRASTAFTFTSELARLTADRGTIGAGIFDDDDAVDLRASKAVASLFITDIWTIASPLTVTGSLRATRASLTLVDQLGTELSGQHRFTTVDPAVGATYQLTPALNAYAGFSVSSRIPTPVELTCADPDDPCRLPNAFVSDPPLDPVTARTWEAGLRDLHGRARWSVTAFRATSVNDIIFVSSGDQRGSGHFENVGRTIRDGLECSADFDASDRLVLFVSYSHVRARFDTDLRLASRFHPDAESFEISVRKGNQIPSIPIHGAKAGLSVRFFERVRAELTGRAQSAQFLRGDESNLLPRLAGFVVLNARLTATLSSRLTATIDVRNLRDARFHTFGMLGDPSLVAEETADTRFLSPAAPRAVWVGLELRL